MSMPKPLLAATALLAACSDLTPTSMAPPAAEPLRYDCVAAVREGTLSCGHVPSAVHATIVGSQNVYVRVTSGDARYDSTTHVFSADVGVTNLMRQPMGTADGVTPDSAGIRVFFHTGPVATAGTGAVAVANPDGYASFTAALQPYFRYDGILATDQAAPPKRWRWQLDPGVERFAFSLYVDARLPPAPVITEIMAHPGTAVEAAGEWFEVHNGALAPLDLSGWKISSGGDAGHVISRSVVVPPGGYVVLGGSADRNANGDTPVIYAYAGVTLGNGTDDWLALRTPEGRLADSVSWGAPPGWVASPPPEGKSLALDSLDADNRWLAGTAWSVSLGFYGNGGYGSPGRWNARPPTFVEITGTGGATCGLDAAGQVWCWGYNADGELGTGDYARRLVPTAMLQGGLRFRAIAQDVGTTCAVELSGAVYCTGKDFHPGWTGDTPRQNTLTLRASGSYRAISGSEGTICAVDADEHWACAGYFQPGSTPSYFAEFTPIPYGFTSFAYGFAHICGLAADGQAYCRGSNEQGQLGVGDTVRRTMFTAVAQPSGVKFTAISAGYDWEAGFTCAISTEGQAYCWGGNSVNQLGIGTSGGSRYLPEKVHQPAGVKFTEITTNAFHTCALSDAGRAYCWGENGSGELGDGTKCLSHPLGCSSTLVPVEVRAPPDVRFSALSRGGARCALVAPRGEAACWGPGMQGQVGDGSQSDRLRPVTVVR
jgi:alpha-tubulin suppressor-like RCC1 family protein